MVYYISQKRLTDRNAGAKAPNDIYALCDRRGWKELFYPHVKRGKGRFIWRIRRGCKVLWFWCRSLFFLKPGDVVFYQHPVRYGSKIACRLIRILQNKQVRFIALVHDLDSLRYYMIYDDSSRTNVHYEDSVLLRQFDLIICHNDRMRDYLISRGISEQKLISLQLFDYLVSDSGESCPDTSRDGLAIAGNLDKKKSGYIYALGQAVPDCTIQLYGVNFDETEAAGKNMLYHGSFEPDELPRVMAGKYGIVWDGNSAETCEGASGHYLRYNNPHKLSLYMAAGIPVITWKEAAIAEFVEENRIGITVNSLKEIPAAAKAISDGQYMRMKENVRVLQERVTTGFYFNRAIERAMNLLPKAGKNGTEE